MKKIIFFIFILIALAIAWSALFGSKGGFNLASDSYSYTETYSDKNGAFAFKYPKDFIVTELPQDNGTIILVQKRSEKKGVQVAISKIDDSDTDIDASKIKASLPDIDIADPIRVTASGSANTGLGFSSNNPAFGGKSAEIWFIDKGKLYQLSTYAEYRSLLSGIFSTWQFK